MINYTVNLSRSRELIERNQQRTQLAKLRALVSVLWSRAKVWYFNHYLRTMSSDSTDWCAAPYIPDQASLLMAGVALADSGAGLHGIYPHIVIDGQLDYSLPVPILTIAPDAPCPEPIVITGQQVLAGKASKVNARSNDKLMGQEDVDWWAGTWHLSSHETRERLILEGYILTEHQMILYTNAKSSYDSRNRRKRSIAAKFEQFDQDYQELKRMVRNGSKPVSELANLLSNA